MKLFMFCGSLIFALTATAASVKNKTQRQPSSASSLYTCSGLEHGKAWSLSIEERQLKFKPSESGEILFSPYRKTFENHFLTS